MRQVVRKIARIGLFVLLGLYIMYLVWADSSRIGLLLTLSGVLGVVVGVILAIELMGKYAVNFGKVTCSELNVVNPDASRTTVEICGDDEGGRVSVYGNDGKGKATLSVRDLSEIKSVHSGDSGGIITVVSMDGKSSASMSANSNHGGRVFVQDKSGWWARMKVEEVSVCGPYGEAKMYVDSDGANVSARDNDRRGTAIMSASVFRNSIVWLRCSDEGDLKMGNVEEVVAEYDEEVMKTNS